MTMSIFKNRKTNVTTTSTLKTTTKSSDGAQMTLTVPNVEKSNEVNDMANATAKKLNSILEKRWKEQERKNQIPYEEKFQELVDEAVFMIKDEWEKTAECGYECRERLNGEITINAMCAFFICEEDRKLYTIYSAPTYPKTGKSCFFEALELPTLEEEKRFVDCVMAKLPPNTTYEMHYAKRDKIYTGNYYSFGITFTITK